MSTDEPAFTYTRIGFEFRVYHNRIDILDKSGFGAKLSGGKRETILLRNVTDVTVKGLTKKLSITTSDAKTHEFNLGPKSDEARQAILSAL